MKHGWVHSLAFGLSGAAWTLFAFWLSPSWPWMVVIAVTLGVLARLVVGRWLRPFAFAVGAATPIVAFAAFLYHPVFADWWHRVDFDATTWRQRSPGADFKWPPRLCMVNNLLATRDMHGWERSKVVSLLGEPDKTRWDHDAQLVYYLGPERGLFRIDSEWLVFTLTADNLVQEYRLARD